MQDEEILRLNSELERLTSVCVCETDLRLEAEQSMRVFQKIEKDLREVERHLKSQLEETSHILRKTERDLQEAEKRVVLAEKEQKYLEAKIGELSQDFERQAERHNALIDEKDIVILRQVMRIFFLKCANVSIPQRLTLAMLTGRRTETGSNLKTKSNAGA